MNKLKLKKRAKSALTIIILVIICMILVHFICNKLSEIDKCGRMCDQKYGHICSNYEIEKFIKGGNCYE